ncbi:transglutaminase-like cysteine peptidase [Pelagibacterium luteolum]|uniref:Predicted transglutaminase-like cysteine proteinase n=1 Tax=Pelagibacterium luteolum TaxID=440168 RepID=A0A1G7S216_9HYPH|nr:transglutaminase-like cysteine peptidase [Pelagibacterium luteolum]SDG17066.1 Predicted transglutaminase-like cysteine proteinase [Pelagibacterium luteolum]
MDMLRAVLIGATAILAMSSAAIANSNVRPPIGLQLYCLKDPSTCRPTPAAAVKWSTEVSELLSGINARVNAAIRPRADAQTDSWTLGARYGDCEDYVLTKHQQLIASGVPAGALSFAFTRTSSGEGHAILVVRTDQGDVVLDNLQSSIVLLQNSGYRIERISQAGLLTWSSHN